MAGNTRDATVAAKELTRENREDSPVVEALRRQVANAFVLYANYKHYHWQTYGPLFRDLHKLFDHFAEDALHTVDPLAERVRMIGPDPPSHPMQMTDLASVAVAAPHSTMEEMVQEADRNALIAIKELREGVRLADEHGDPGTVDLLSKTVQVYEKHEWWLRDILRKGDGLTNQEQLAISGDSSLKVREEVYASPAVDDASVISLTVVGDNRGREAPPSAFGPVGERRVRRTRVDP